jgi:hypothetical protein
MTVKVNSLQEKQQSIPNYEPEIQSIAAKTLYSQLSATSPATCSALCRGRPRYLHALVAIIIKTSLDSRLVAIAVGCRCLLGVLLHKLFRSLSCGTDATLLLQRLRWLFLRVVVDLLPGALGSVRRREASADCLDHLREPEQVEQVKSDVGGQVRSTEPEWQIANFHECSGLAMRVGKISMMRDRIELVHVVFRRGVSLGDCAIDVIEDQVAAVVAPEDTTTEEGRGEERAVDSLVDRAGEVELVAEPVDVQERTRKLVKKEHWRIVVEERTL